MKNISVNGHDYEVIELIGHGKGGYSYLVKIDSNVYIAKQIHHEPCSYYEFSNKIESELRDYKRLLSLIPNNIPKIIEYDQEKEIIIKEYIDGPTVDKLVIDELMKPSYFEQIEKMAKIVNEAGFNLDYFPTNFVVQNDTLFYVDFELNEYSDTWNFENWGKKYWSRTDEFMHFFHPNSIPIYTDRLILRKLQSEDFEQVLNNNSYSSTPNKFNPWLVTENKDELKEYLEKVYKEYDDSNTMRWAIVLQENQQIIGCIDVSHRDENDVSHLNFAISEAYAAKGLMSEAVKAVLKLTFERGINVVAIDALEDNTTTNMVAIKNGFDFIDTTEELNKDDPSLILRINHYIKRK